MFMQNSSLKPLSELKIGGTALVKNVLGEGRIRRRLFDMGITPGCEIYLRKKAPLGDPMEVTLRGYELTLRNDEASLVVCEFIDEPRDGKVSR